MLRREDVQDELKLSADQIAEVEHQHHYLVPEILTEIQHKRLSQLTLQTLDLRTIFLGALPKLMRLNTDRYDEFVISVGKGKVHQNGRTITHTTISTVLIDSLEFKISRHVFVKS